ncbi:MAG: 4-hydroxybenzoate octaprenyltransferase [Gammaproteobacteria bacterium]|nr:4-hydroxybenzoate octaprenyltransferase [Gammaproteobacteria bacterium]
MSREWVITIRERLVNYSNLIRLDRPIGILLLLWPSLWALWMAAKGNPPWQLVVIFALGVALMRSAGCAINDFADRNIDGQVERTSRRPVATGVVTPKEAIAVFVVLCLLAFGLVLLLNWQTVAMSLVALVLAAIYPFMKRYTNLPQLVLGMAFGWAVPMAFMAVTETVPHAAWLLYIATVIWALVYDTQYAMVDREDDIRIGVKSTAILFGVYDRFMIGLLQLAMLGILLLVGNKSGLGDFYWIGVAVAACFALYQQKLIRTRTREGCFKAFLNNNWFGASVFIGLVLDYTMKSV